MLRSPFPASVPGFPMGKSVQSFPHRRNRDTPKICEKLAHVGKTSLGLPGPTQPEGAKPMSFVNIERSTQQQRLLLAQQIGELRKATGMRQQDLAEAAHVDRKTIGNMERGAFAPQPDVLRRVLAVLGVPTEADVFDEDTARWAEMFATLISRIDSERRPEAARRVLAVLVQEVSGPAVGGSPEAASNVVLFPTEETDIDVDEIEAETRRAATHDDTAANEFDTPDDDDAR